MIKHTQKALFGGGYVGANEQSGVSCPDFERIAEAFVMKYGAIYQTAWEEDINAAIDVAQEYDGPMIIEIFMHPEQPFLKLMPIVEDGKVTSLPLEDLSPLLPRDVFNKAMK